MRLIRTYKLSETESEIVAGCKKNDRTMQKALYDRYKSAMYSTAYRITGNSDLAHDVLQEAFIDIFENIDDFRFESAIGAWIKTIVVRKAIRLLKLEFQYETLEIVDKLTAIDETPDFSAEELDKAIQSLPVSSRAVFMLVEVEGYKHQEVAEILGISEGTSKSQLNYSKKLLQRRLYERV
jgi:RNA polymerase sigma factor (sigma-70 family)